MEEIKEKKRMLSGIKPSGDLTLGSYLGAIKNWSSRSEEYDCFYFMADLHAITVRQNPADLRRRTLEQLAQYIACGLDPEKNTLFIQSHVRQHAELGWVLNCYAMFGELSRMTQFKDKSAKNADNINGGLFTYPSLMAADILLYQPDYVPVGEDQLPMLEQAREIVHSFNSIYGEEVLVMPKAFLPDNQACMRLPGTDGKAKMSKSLGNCIYLSDNPDDIRKKVMSMYTDPDHIRIEDPGKLEGNTVFTYLDAFCNDAHFEHHLPEYANLQELKDHYTKGGLGDVKVKKFLYAVLMEELEPIQARRHELEKDIPAVMEILREGSVKAREVAAQTLSEVKHAMKIDYFE